MKEQIDKAIAYIEKLPIEGCITGSCYLGTFNNQDIDVFVYNEKSFSKILFDLHYNPMFQIIEPLEQWKFDQFINIGNNKNSKFEVNTIKFLYNTCVDVNIVMKKNGNDIFSVLSSFDMNIICKGYDIQTKQFLDLSGDSTVTEIADWNRWNTAFYRDDIWTGPRILRQLDRCFKYHNRGYNTDSVVIKYMQMIDNLQKYESVFNSNNFNEKLEKVKLNTSVLKEICIKWLDCHEMTEKELNLIKETLKNIQS
jgi:hypothetical protein